MYIKASFRAEILILKTLFRPTCWFLKSLHKFIYCNLFMSRSEEVKWEKADGEPQDVNR